MTLTGWSRSFCGSSPALRRRNIVGTQGQLSCCAHFANVHHMYYARKTGKADQLNIDGIAIGVAAIVAPGAIKENL